MGVELTKENLDELIEEEDRPEDDDDDAKSIATTVLSTARSLRSIHSKKSMAVKTRHVKASMQVIPEEKGKHEYKEPKIVVHQEENRRDKTDPSNLPYLNRN